MILLLYFASRVRRSSNRVIYTIDDGVHFRMAKGKMGSLSKLALGTQEFSLLSLAQVCTCVSCLLAKPATAFSVAAANGGMVDRGGYIL